MWVMTQGTKSNNATTKPKPGQKLLTWGAGVLAVGLLFVVIGLGTVEVGASGEETGGGPTPAAWLLVIAGGALVVWGFGKRMLAAAEKD